MFRKIPTRVMSTAATRSHLLPNPRPLGRLLTRRPTKLPQKSPSRPAMACIKQFTTTKYQRAPQTGKVKTQLEEERQKLLHKKLEANPEKVTTTSSMTPIFGRRPKPPPGDPADEIDMLRGLKSDLHTIKETFALKEVPKEVYYIGLGGMFPYASISATTLYLAWDINYAHHHELGYLVSAETAENLLHFLEPVQVGLGAVILSFLGAVHWGLEMAEYGGKHGYQRYALSILAPALAWPTILLPFEYALITQFAGFTGMYFADSTATGWGWAPPWYMTYRFILTFVVGASIVGTLVGRGQIGGEFSQAPSPASHLQTLRDWEWEDLEKKECERRRTLRKEVVEEKKKLAEKTKRKEQDECDDKKDENGGGEKA